MDITTRNDLAERHAAIYHNRQFTVIQSRAVKVVVVVLVQTGRQWRRHS